MGDVSIALFSFIFGWLARGIVTNAVQSICNRILTSEIGKRKILEKLATLERSE